MKVSIKGLHVEHQPRPRREVGAGVGDRLDPGDAIVIGVMKKGSGAKAHVVMTFEKPVSWVGMVPKLAEETAKLLMKFAKFVTPRLLA